jgi:hypothetical protein
LARRFAGQQVNGLGNEAAVSKLVSNRLRAERVMPRVMDHNKMPESKTRNLILFVHLNHGRRLNTSSILNAIAWMFAARSGSGRFMIMSSVTSGP